MIVLPGRHPRTLVVLDGPHACDDVFAELELYAGFVSSGSYCVVMDTKLDHIHAATPSAPYHSSTGFHLIDGSEERNSDHPKGRRSILLAAP